MKSGFLYLLGFPQSFCFYEANWLQIYMQLFGFAIFFKTFSENLTFY